MTVMSVHSYFLRYHIVESFLSATLLYSTNDAFCDCGNTIWPQMSKPGGTPYPKGFVKYLPLC